MERRASKAVLKRAKLEEKKGAPMTAKLAGRFVVKEGDPGRFVLSFETSSGQLVTFELQAHATIETAGQLAREMNRAVVGIQMDGLGVFTWNEVEQPSTKP